MENLVHALNLATDLSRTMFTDFSDNRRPRVPPTEFEKIELNMKLNFINFEISRIRQNPDMPRNGYKAPENVVAYGDYAFNHGKAGNCLEIACAGAYLLDTRYGVVDWHLVNYGQAVDHVFLAIGDVGNCDTNFANWPAECAIFDGWAQIACLATNYPMKWQAKMSEWANSEQTVILPSIDGGQYFTPATSWRRVVNEPKTILV